MGVKFTIGDGKQRIPLSYSLTEGSTPLAGGDSTGSSGDMSIQIPHTPRNILARGKGINFIDTFNGETIGTVRTVSNQRDQATDDLTISTRLGKLNIIKAAQPFAGTLLGAITYYLSLAGIVDDFIVDDTIKNLNVTVPGFQGNLWTNVKQFAAANLCDISQVNNVIYVRPVRLSEARRNQTYTRTITASSDQLAQAVEVKYYNPTWYENKLAYPAKGWDKSNQVLSVDANEVQEYDLELSSSLVSVKQPYCVSPSLIGPGYVGPDSVYAVIGEDNLPVTAAQWNAQGGKVELAISEDTKSLHVKITGPSPLIKNTDRVTSFRLAYSDGETAYPAFWVMGKGTFLDEQTLTVSTGVSKTVTEQEVGETVDNPFVTTLASAWTIAKRLLPEWNGRSISLSETARSVNARGTNGAVAYVSYNQAKETTFAGVTYVQAKSLMGGKTFDQVKDVLNQSEIASLANQTFGNVGGARIWDSELARYFRVRSATIKPESISMEADDDQNYSDFYSYTDMALGSRLNNEIMGASMSGLTYDDVFAYGTGVFREAVYGN